MLFFGLFWPKSVPNDPHVPSVQVVHCSVLQYLKPNTQRPNIRPLTKIAV